MDVSTRSLSWFGILLFTIGAVGCAQPGVSEIALPTAPSSPSAGPSASSVPPSGIPIATLGPGASYDATGPWHFVVADVHGNVEETFDANFTQDSEGNISFVDDDGNLITLKRLGTGVIITYRLSFTAEATPCDFSIHGTGRLDTRTNTMTLNAAIRDNDCSHGVLAVTATKAS
jgi:hypothetical protein